MTAPKASKMLFVKVAQSLWRHVFFLFLRLLRLCHGRASAWSETRARYVASPMERCVVKKQRTGECVGEGRFIPLAGLANSPMLSTAVRQAGRQTGQCPSQLMSSPVRGSSRYLGARLLSVSQTKRLHGHDKAGTPPQKENNNNCWPGR